MSTQMPCAGRSNASAVDAQRPGRLAPARVFS